MATMYSIKGIRTKEDAEALEKALEAEGIHAELDNGTIKLAEGLKENPKLQDIIENLGFRLK